MHFRHILFDNFIDYKEMNARCPPSNIRRISTANLGEKGRLDRNPLPKINVPKASGSKIPTAQRAFNNIL